MFSSSKRSVIVYAVEVTIDGITNIIELNSKAEALSYKHNNEATDTLFGETPRIKIITRKIETITIVSDWTLDEE